MDLGAILFYLVAAITLVGALGVVTTRNVVYGRLLLILALSLTGLVYLLLLADFLALVQILIYGGTVSVLLLFALMLTRPQDNVALNHRGWPLAVLGAVLLLGSSSSGRWPRTGRTAGAVSARGSGRGAYAGSAWSSWGRSSTPPGWCPSRSPRCCSWWRCWGRCRSPAPPGPRTRRKEPARGWCPLVEHILVFSAAMFGIGACTG